VIAISIRLLSPLAHGSFSDASAGNMTLFRREPIVGLPGNPRVPSVSGNSLRGILRRGVMRDVFARAGISRNAWMAEGRGRQWDRLYAALANGGHLEKPDASIDPVSFRQMRTNLPPLSVLGAAMYRWVLPGRTRFGWLWPVCSETVAAGLVEGGEEPLIDAESLMSETSLVRHIEREQHDPEQSGVTPMPTTTETLSAGTLLRGRVDFDNGTSDVEKGVIAWGLGQITHLGGKGGAGFGMVRIEHDGDPAPYVAWLAQATPGLGAVLTILADELAK